MRWCYNFTRYGEILCQSRQPYTYGEALFIFSLSQVRGVASLQSRHNGDLIAIAAHVYYNTIDTIPYGTIVSMIIPPRGVATGDLPLPGVIVICVSLGYVCPRTYIASDLCFPNKYIPSDICFPSRLCVP